MDVSINHDPYWPDDAELPRDDAASGPVKAPPKPHAPRASSRRVRASDADAKTKAGPGARPGRTPPTKRSDIHGRARSA